ncbi:MAG: AAA family ATPase [Clostridiales bacterium]|nr:AAA family ATPase [Clostridiales bacterium]
MKTNRYAHLRRGHSYYVDKSMFIKEFFESKGHVNLIARPRRFGKSRICGSKIEKGKRGYG